MIKSFSNSYHNTLFNFFTSKIKRPSTVKNNGSSEEVSKNYDFLVFGSDEDKLDYSFAECCKPIPGDHVFGFITINDGIRVHKMDCPNALSLQSKFSYRIIKAKWIDSTQEDFEAEIILTGIHLGLINDLTRIISENLHVNIKSMNFTSESGVFEGSIKVFVKSNVILSTLISKLQKVEGIDKTTESKTSMHDF